MGGYETAAPHFQWELTMKFALALLCLIAAGCNRPQYDGPTRSKSEVASLRFSRVNLVRLNGLQPKGCLGSLQVLPGSQTLFLTRVMDNTELEGIEDNSTPIEIEVSFNAEAGHTYQVQSVNPESFKWTAKVVDLANGNCVSK